MVVDKKWLDKWGSDLENCGKKHAISREEYLWHVQHDDYQSEDLEEEELVVKKQASKGGRPQGRPIDEMEPAQEERSREVMVTPYGDVMDEDSSHETGRDEDAMSEEEGEDDAVDEVVLLGPGGPVALVTWDEGVDGILPCNELGLHSIIDLHSGDHLIIDEPMITITPTSFSRRLRQPNKPINSACQFDASVANVTPRTIDYNTDDCPGLMRLDALRDVGDINM